MKPTTLLTALLAAVSTPPGAQAGEGPKPLAAAPTTRPSAPFMFNEASLPLGFPKPGPVGQIIIKDYPAYRIAKVTSDNANGGSDGMFWPLFQHIKKNDIAMTAPVEMTYPATTAGAGTPKGPDAMAFMYARPDMGKLGQDGIVQVLDVPAMTVVSISARGNYTDRRMEASVAQLNAWLQANATEWQVAGPPRYMGYNSPMVPGFLALGEVQISIARRTP